MTQRRTAKAARRFLAKARVTREEYLIRHHEHLLHELKDAFNNINKNLVSSYVFCLLLVGFEFGFLEKGNLAGFTISAKPNDVRVMISVVICLLYILISYQLLKMSRLLLHYKNNSVKLRRVNDNASDIDMGKVRDVATGVLGLIVESARCFFQFSVKATHKLNAVAQSLRDAERRFEAQRQLVRASPQKPAGDRAPPRTNRVPSWIIPLLGCLSIALLPVALVMILVMTLLVAYFFC